MPNVARPQALAELGRLCTQESSARSRTCSWPKNVAAMNSRAEQAERSSEKEEQFLSSNVAVARH